MNTIPKDKKVCFNCENMMWMVGLGLGLRCRLSSPPKIIEHREHTCDKFKSKHKMEINKEELHRLYMEWVNKVADECDWKTTFHTEEIVHAIAHIIETHPELIKYENNDV